MSGPTTRPGDENSRNPPFHALEGTTLVTRLGSDPERGLSDEEANRRLSRLGPNELTVLPGRPGWLRFLDQFHNPLLYTLLVTGLIKLWIDSLGEALVIWSVTLINAVIGFVQEDRAESSIAALARSVRTQVDVVRDGRELRLPSEQLVVGDLVRLSAGASQCAVNHVVCWTRAVDDAALSRHLLHPLEPPSPHRCGWPCSTCMRTSSSTVT